MAKLNPDPPDGPPVDGTAADTARATADADALLDRIWDLLGVPESLFADDTLRGIAETVRLSKYVTEGQRRAVDNIAAAIDRKKREPWDRADEGAPWSRRYEGRK